MNISDYTIKRIKETAKIYDVVSDFIKLRRSGVRYTGLCPFHEDRHDGNFIVYPKDNCYKCFTCEAKGDPIKFLMQLKGMDFLGAIRYLGKKYSIPTDGVTVDVTPTQIAPPPPLPLVTFPMTWVRERQNTQNDNLVNWIQSIPWDASQRRNLVKALDEYHIGHSTVFSNGPHEFTLFWQIDEQQRVRTADYMKYNTNGRRVKKEQERYNTDWFHSLLSRPVKKDGVDTYPYRRFFDPDKQRVEMTLFGMHLLDKYPDAAVHIVESEKTALLMATAYGNHPMQVWMASCGASNITRERLMPLIRSGRNIVLHPDRDGVTKWKDLANRLRYNKAFIDATAVEEWWKPEDGDKADIADVVVRIVSEGSKEPIESISENPYVRELTDKLELEPYE
jgi:hypothetical protein